MSKLIARIIYFIIYILEYFYNFFLKKNFQNYLYNFIRNNSYKIMFINKKKIKFFCPNDICLWRFRTFLSKEPETIKFIDQFDNSKRIVFWDIGANIGIFSIYAALKKNIKIFSFEPSFNNLSILGENISINHLHDKITICPIAINFNKNKQIYFSEPYNSEGSAHNSIEKSAKKKVKIYKTIGLNGDFLVQNNIADYPDYIKCDVDGLEYSILIKLKKILKNKKLKGILIESNNKKIIIKISNFLKKFKFEIDKRYLKYQSKDNLIFKREMQQNR